MQNRSRRNQEEEMVVDRAHSLETAKQQKALKYLLSTFILFMSSAIYFR